MISFRLLQHEGLPLNMNVQLANYLNLRVLSFQCQGHPGHFLSHHHIITNRTCLTSLKSSVGIWLV
jgi:hypothetical protein